MAKKTAPLLPSTELRLQALGKRLRLARLRRRLTGKQVAERAGMTPVTLRSMERGGSGVTIGAYVAVMQVLGVERDLDLLLKDDPLGRGLQDAALTRRPRSMLKRAVDVPHSAESGLTQGTAEKNMPEHTDSQWGGEGDFISTTDLAALIKPPASGKKGRGR